jgi:hypothetical protein
VRWSTPTPDKSRNRTGGFGPISTSPVSAFIRHKNWLKCFPVLVAVVPVSVGVKDNEVILPLKTTNTRDFAWDPSKSSRGVGTQK